MDLLARRGRIGVSKACAGRLDGCLECLRPARDKQTINHPPADARLNEVFVKRRLPLLGEGAPTVPHEVLIQRLHELVHAIPGSALDEVLALIPDIRVGASVRAVRQCSEDCTEDASEPRGGRAEFAFRDLQDGAANGFRSIVPYRDGGVLWPVAETSRESLFTHSYAPAALSNAAVSGRRASNVSPRSAALRCSAEVKVPL